MSVKWNQIRVYNRHAIVGCRENIKDSSADSEKQVNKNKNIKYNKTSCLVNYLLWCVGVVYKHIQHEVA